jgi:hypothetical protein
MRMRTIMRIEKKMMKMTIMIEIVKTKNMYNGPAS